MPENVTEMCIGSNIIRKFVFHDMLIIIKINQNHLGKDLSASRSSLDCMFYNIFQ